MEKFNWDVWANKSSFSTVWSNAAYIPKVRALPTCYNDDQKIIYISSLDLAFDTNSVKELESALSDIVDSYKSRSLQGQTALNALNLAVRQCDFNEICLLLNEIKNRDDNAIFSQDYDYSSPDELFKKLTTG